ncbi:MAG: DMT family transporter [Acidobacteriota bacterium]|nr:DMT family transporter [Acidobacteriota bacterium]
MAAGLLPLLLVLGTSLASSGFDLSRKVLGRHLAPVPMVFLLAAASVPLFGAALLATGGAHATSAYWPPALASVLLNTAANLAFIQSVRIAPLSSTVPLLSLTPATTALFGMLILGERPAPAALVGIALVIAGALWLNLSPHRPPSAAPPAVVAVPLPEAAGDDPRHRSTFRRPGAWLMAGTALLWSLSIPLDKLAVARAAPPFHGLVLTAGVALGTFAVLASRGRLAELTGLRRGMAPFLCALLASTLDLGFQLLALRVVQVGVIETVKRGIGNLLAVLLGRIVFGEALTGPKLAAATLMAAGVALILL